MEVIDLFKGIAHNVMVTDLVHFVLHVAKEDKKSELMKNDYDCNSDGANV